MQTRDEVSNSPNPSRVYIRRCKHGKRFLFLKYKISAQFFSFGRKQDLLEHYSLFSLIGDKLMSHTLTLTTYNVLFEVSSKL